jgi:hypothetical protein
MSENKTGKYFKYAIGEVILVVFGILIALGINNWNEHRKSKVKEIEILTDFQKAIQFDIYQMDSIIPHYNRAKASINNILNHLENDLPYSDELASHFFNSTLIYDSGGLTVTAYETLKSSGLDLITNKEIRDLIISVYDENNKWMLTWEQRYINLIFDSKKDIYSSRFKDFWNGDYKDKSVVGTMEPTAYEQLKNDNDYKFYLRSQKNLIGWLIKKPVENTRIECKKLLKLINEELKL